MNDNIINKLVTGITVGAILGLGSLFHWHLSDISREIREAKVQLRVEIRDAKGEIRELETRLRSMEISSSKQIRR